MAIEFNYLADKMHANLGVNLNRQKYAPLDGSTVFTSIKDFEYYINMGAFNQNMISSAPSNDGISDYVLSTMTLFPYVGQIVSIVDSTLSSVSVYKITDVAKCEYTPVGKTYDFAAGLSADEDDKVGIKYGEGLSVDTDNKLILDFDIDCGGAQQ
jgi:hypothetical protein